MQKKFEKQKNFIENLKSISTKKNQIENYVEKYKKKYMIQQFDSEDDSTLTREKSPPKKKSSY